MIWLDDEPEMRGHRFPAEAGWIHCRWPEEVIEHLKQGDVETLSLDHDLGEDCSYQNPRTGYNVLLWIEEQMIKNDYVPPRYIHLHTMNPVAREKMSLVLRNIRTE